jgi:hypothetical protein
MDFPAPSFYFNAKSKNALVGRLFKNGLYARRAITAARDVTSNTLSDEVCSATPQMAVFQQPAKRRESMGSGDAKQRG